MNGPWDGYAAGTPESRSENWTTVDVGGAPEWRYIGPTTPAPGPSSYPSAPIQGTPLYSTGNQDTSLSYTYTPPASTPAGGYNNPAKEGYVAPPPAPGGDYFTLPGAQAPAAGSAPGPVTGIGGGASDFMSPVATGAYGLGTAGNAPVAPAVPLPNAAGTPQYVAGGSNSGFVAGGGGGGYSEPPASPAAGGMMLPNGQMFGAPKQMAPDGSFDPFLWSGTTNPMPPPNPMRLDILGELGLLPNQPNQSPNVMPPRNYVEAKLGVGATGAPSLPPPPPAPPQGTMPPPVVGGIPNLPPPILPGTRRRF